MKRILLIIAAALLVLTGGTAVAYYRTAALGYDNANLLSVYDGGFQLLYLDVNVAKAESLLQKMSEFTPDRFISI